MTVQRDRHSAEIAKGEEIRDLKGEYLQNSLDHPFLVKRPSRRGVGNGGAAGSGSPTIGESC